VKRQEAERAEKGLPPRVEFFKDANEDSESEGRSLGDKEAQSE